MQDIPEPYDDYVRKGDLDGLLLKLYVDKLVDWFKWVYLCFDCKFPVSKIVEVVDLVNEKSSKICRVDWGRMDVECVEMYITDEVREKYGDEIRMIQFLMDMRKYSICKLVSGKFYYLFDRRRYGTRIEDFLN